MISFEPFWKNIKAKGLSQYCLIHKYGLSSGTLDAMRKNKSMTFNTLNDLCRITGLSVQEIICYIPDDAEKNSI